MKLNRLLLIMTTVCFSNPAFCQVDSLNRNSGVDSLTVVTKSTNSPTTQIPGNQDEIYNFKPAVDVPIIAISAGWSIYAFSQIYSKDRSTEQQILDLDENDIPKFDRWAAGMSDENADMTSDYLFYGSIPFAFTLLLSKDIRNDGLKVGLLYLETMSITGLFYTGTVYFVDRYRPETYDTKIPVDERTSGGYKNAFMAGHPAMVAASTFFTASVFSAYHPKSAISYTAYGVAIVATGTTVYLRHLAGKHFPSDLLVGTGIGTLTGLLVPHFHKIKSGKDQKLGLYPFKSGNASGVTALYRF